MPLWLLAPLVIVSISLVVWLVKRNGGDAPPRFPDGMDDPAIKAVIARFQQAHEDAVIRMSALAPGGRAILMALEGNETAIAVPFGRKIVFRRIERANGLVRLSGSTILVDLREAGFPALAFDYGAPESAAAAFSTFFAARTPAHA
ncbi:MAG: hypothetical protein MUC58_05935 [Rhizobiaceae bacterium]|jgi:hypothetical protein|nr:hypothetical protein [Rhizobiaceae bacterium]